MDNPADREEVALAAQQVLFCPITNNSRFNLYEVTVIVNRVLHNRATSAKMVAPQLPIEATPNGNDHDPN